jgi:hypothetical protein
MNGWVFSVVCSPEAPTKILYATLLSSPYTCYMPSPSHSPWLDPNNIWWAVQIMKLLIMKFSPLPCYLVPLRPKYSPQHRILRHPQRLKCNTGKVCNCLIQVLLTVVLKIEFPIFSISAQRLSERTVLKRYSGRFHRSKPARAMGSNITSIYCSC